MPSFRKETKKLFRAPARNEETVLERCNSANYFVFLGVTIRRCKPSVVVLQKNFFFIKTLCTEYHGFG
jgi:hypothetical protein